MFKVRWLFFISLALFLIGGCDDSSSSSSGDLSGDGVDQTGVDQDIEENDQDTVEPDLDLEDIDLKEVVDNDIEVQDDITEVEETLDDSDIDEPDEISEPDEIEEADEVEEIVDPCAELECPDDQHCVEDEATQTASCVNNTCEDLSCSATEECQLTEGGGALCVDISCASDLDCESERYCDDNGLCVDDLCVPGERRCQGDDVEECATNGSQYDVLMTCPMVSGGCMENGGDAYCLCSDDWECPQYTECEAGICEGTGAAPTCSLEPEPFTNVLPTPEIVWGAAEQQNQGVDMPYDEEIQVVMTPVVANLDDDNGDGYINELDFPEIIFLSFRNSEFTSNGVLRAIHGGGPNKGGDFFASCGAATWHEGDDFNVECSGPIIDSTSSLAVGDLNYDGVPEIIAIGEGDQLLIYSNIGELIDNYYANAFDGGNPAPAIANLDGQGLAEVIVGRDVFTFHEVDGQPMVLDHFEGTETVGKNGQGPASCVADLDLDGRMEIIAGTVVYHFPVPPAGVTSQAECTGSESEDDELAYCEGRLSVHWDAQVVNGSVSNREGFCAIADVWGNDPSLAPGPANPLDGIPEVILVDSNGNLVIFDGITGLRLMSDSITSSRGGAPNVDDFDGDGFPEIGTAGSTYYNLYDLQDSSDSCPAWPEVMIDGAGMPAANLPRSPNGVACTSDADCAEGSLCNLTSNTCVCLHNGWRRQTEDDSSRVTGSSVFDFNGDGAAEVVYNDECRFRVYRGLDGEVYFTEPSESRTRIEYPVVADVDNDGNAEIIFATSNESGFCSENLDSEYNAGLEVWGDAGDYWVSARRIWNQHTYHITNIREDGGVPLYEPPNWLSHNGRLYNNYRSNPRSYGVAPDLTLAAMQTTSPDAACGLLSELLDITLLVENAGDLRVGPGVVIGFEGHWLTEGVVEALLDDSGNPLQTTLTTSLDPHRSIYVTTSYDAANNAQARLPDEVVAIVDINNAERECDETNQGLTQVVDGGEQLADLRLELSEQGGSCPSPSVDIAVINDGSVDAPSAVVDLYQGDPEQGGILLERITVPGPIAAGATVFVTHTFSSFPLNRSFVLYGVVNPDGEVDECDAGDNKAQGSTMVCIIN